MALLTVNDIVHAGTKPTFVAASSSDTAPTGSGHNTFAVYKNAGALPVTLTVTAPGTNSYGEPNPDPTYTIGATTGEVWVPLHREYDVDGLTTLALSGTTSVTVAIVKTAF